MTTTLLLLLLAADGGTSTPPLLQRPMSVKYIFVDWDPRGVPGHVKAPCPAPDVMASIAGFCWGMTKDKAPCPSTALQNSGRCFIPVVELKEVPAS